MLVDGKNVKVYDISAIGDSDDLFVAVLLCSDCGVLLNETKPMTGKQMGREWTSIVMSSGFAAGKCKNGCRSTFSDLNINTEIKILAAEAQ